jgi:hypothetical protein
MHLRSWRVFGHPSRNNQGAVGDRSETDPGWPAAVLVTVRWFLLLQKRHFRHLTARDGGNIFCKIGSDVERLP